MTVAEPSRPDTQPDPASVAPEAVLRVEDVTMRFGDLDALREVTVELPRGTILGVIGPSGAGKTTLIRILTGALTPTKGKAVVLSENPRRFHRRTRERIGYMPQQFTLYPDLTAGENVDFVASLFGLLWFRRRRRVKEVLNIVDLWAARGRRASDLSGGMQRRLELASALVHDPELLFLDEPTAGIDPLLRARIWEELHRLKRNGRTLIVTTQYVNEAEECDLVALIAHGRLAALAEPDALRRQATGGDIVEIETARAFDGSVLDGRPMVRRVTQMTPRSIRVVVADAGSAMPAIVSAITETGVDVVKAGEYRLTFDEVFAELVGRSEDESTAQQAAMAAHERNEDEARLLVERELDQRAADARTTPLDERAEIAETDGRGPAATAPDDHGPTADAVAGGTEVRTEETRLADGQPDPGIDRTLDDQARNLPPEDDVAGPPVRPGFGDPDRRDPSDAAGRDQEPGR